MESASLEELLDALQSPDPGHREAAAREMGNREDPGFLPHLLGVLQDPSEKVRWRSLQSVAKLGFAEPDEKILGLLSDASARVRAEAAKLIGLAGRKEQANALIPLLDDPDVRVRYRAIEALGEIAGPGEEARGRIADMLEDGDNNIRLHAALALGKWRDRSALSLLVPGLGDPNPNVRGAAAWSLGNLGDERAIEPLVRALEDGGESVRVCAYRALDAFGPKALPALEEARARTDGAFRAILDRLIEDITEGEDEEGQD